MLPSFPGIGGLEQFNTKILNVTRGIVNGRLSGACHFFVDFLVNILGEWEESDVGPRLKEFSSTTFKAEYSFSLSKCENIGNET